MFQIPARPGEDGLPLAGLWHGLPVPDPGLRPSLPRLATLPRQPGGLPGHRTPGEAAKLWSLAEVEQKSSDLLQAAKSVLQDPGFSHELKLEAMGWLVERLLQLVPVFEVEDAILPPRQRSRCCSG